MLDNDKPETFPLDEAGIFNFGKIAFSTTGFSGSTTSALVSSTTLGVAFGKGTLEVLVEIKKVAGIIKCLDFFFSPSKVIEAKLH